MRWCISSPMASAREMMSLREMGPDCRSASFIAGPRSFWSQRSRSRTSGELAPKRITLPMPSLKVL